MQESGAKCLLVKRLCLSVFTQLVWKSILSNVEMIDDSTDFFKSGAASMDVVR